MDNVTWLLFGVMIGATISTIVQGIKAYRISKELEQDAWDAAEEVTKL
jgi:hypothetical protein